MTHDGNARIHLGGATNAYDASTIQYGACTIQADGATTSSSYCILDESGWIKMNRGVRDILIPPNSSGKPTNDHEYTYGATKNEPDFATVELRFRPCPQSTTIHPECFKRFKIVIALLWRFQNRKDSSRITTVLLRFTPMSLRCY